VSPELARERGLTNNGWATIISARTAIEAKVMVTERMVPLRIAGRTVHQIGLPYHWGVGNDALVSGDSANDLFGVTLDPNVHIQETKVASCDIQPGRRPRGRALLSYVAAHRARAHVTLATGNQQRTPPTGADGQHASEDGTHSHSSGGQVAEGHAPSGQDTDAGPDEGVS
jgi:formate dehydrogenase major subunit